MTLERFPVRAALVLVMAIAAVSAFAQSSLFARLQWWFDDAQQRIFPTQLPMDHVIVFDVDEDSMEQLEGELGAWPYARDVYARVARFLSANGAKAVAYDILFAEGRDGDAEFARALDGRSVLAAAALPYTQRRQTAYHAQLGELAFPGTAGDAVLLDAAKSWRDLTLPLPALTSPSGARAGVISGAADEDGTLRRIHVVHQAYGQFLPSLPLAALVAGETLERPALEGGLIRIGKRAWPTATDGSILLRFPGNARALPIVPFYQLAWAARGAPGTAQIGDLVRGKIVFIGSTSAILGDSAFTPFGQMPGLHIVALATEMLHEGSVQRPSRPAIDGLLLALALSPSLLVLWRAGAARPRDFLVGLAAIVLVIGGAGAALHASGQNSLWLFALHAGAAAQAGAFMAWLFVLYRERQRLYYEKLAAEEANRMKTVFLNRMTHELRTPITAIRGFNKINHLTDDLGREQRVHNSAIIARNCDHLLALVNENLDLARIESGQLHTEPRPADPVALFDDAVLTMQNMAQQKGLQLSSEVHRPIPAAVSIDPLRLRQVLINLLGNAIKFTATGSVALEARWEGGRLWFAVRDTGPGIPPEALARVFEPFTRVAGSNIEGTGLGLSVTQALVRLMDGTIEATSTPGQGTCFTVTVAAAEAEMPVAEATPEANASVPPPLSGRVLVAEDSSVLRELIQAQLTRLGLTYLVVADGLAAVEVATSADFDLILMDLEMPRMDGYEAAHVLRARGYQRPIVAFTAHETGEPVERALQEGCDRVLPKTCSIERLRDTLAPLLAARQSASASPSAADTGTTIPVHVDGRRREDITVFLENARRDASRIRVSLDSRDLEFVRLVGDNLREHAGSFGLHDLAQLGGMLEHAARNVEVDSTRRIAVRIENYLDRVEPRYD